MSDYVARPWDDEEATSGTLSQAHESGWMSHWMNTSPKPSSVVNNSSLIRYENGGNDNKSCRVEDNRLKIEDDYYSFGRKLGIEADEIPTGMISENLTKKVGDFRHNTSHSPVPSLKLCQDTENSSTMKAQTEHEFGVKAMSLALSLGKDAIVKNFDMVQRSRSMNREPGAMSCSHPLVKGGVDSRPSAFKEAGPTSYIPLNQSKHGDSSGPVVLFERHCSNDNFTCLDQGHCKYQKFCTFLFHEKKMNDELSLALRQSGGLQMQPNPSTNKNFLPFFLRKQSENIHGHSSTGVFPTHTTPSDVDQSRFCHGCQAGDRAPCSLRNVETMRICTMVDSVENSPGGPSKMSQRSHHFMFTKETCLNMLEAHQESTEPTLSANHEGKTFGFPRSQGVKIQPLWTSTDSEEKENTGNPSTCKVGSRNESSAETEAVRVEASGNQHIMSGTESCPLNKDDAVGENVKPVALDSSTEKSRSKGPMAEIPDINEEIPGIQPAVSSTDGMEPSTSRVHSLDAKQLFPCDEQTSKPESNVQKDNSRGLEATSRWIKRLKSSPDSFGVGTKSSELEEASSHEKFSLFFNGIMKSNKASLENMLSKHNGNGPMVLDQNTKSIRNSESSIRSSKSKSQNMMSDCSWIQRWCRHSTIPPTKNPESLVICEPHSLKLGQDELSKKQFPSIAAMALMGKAMNGFRPCEFRKRGPVVVWNSNEY